MGVPFILIAPLSCFSFESEKKKKANFPLCNFISFHFEGKAMNSLFRVGSVLDERLELWFKLLLVSKPKLLKIIT